MRKLLCANGLAPVVFLITGLAAALGLSIQGALIYLGLHRLQDDHRSFPWHRNS